MAVSRIGTLVNAYIEAGGVAIGVKTGRAYVDVGTLHGYRSATRLLDRVARQGAGHAFGAPVQAPKSASHALPRLVAER